MKQYVLSRKVYKDVKKMDHQQMDTFWRKLYENAYKDGRQDAEGLSEDDVKTVILSIKGIGSKRAEDIINALTEANKKRS